VKSSSDMSGPGYPPDDRVRVGTGTQAAGGRLQSTATGSGTVPVATAAGQLPVTPSRSPPPPNGRRRSDSESESARSDLPVCWLSNEYFRVPSLSGRRRRHGTCAGTAAPAQPHRDRPSNSIAAATGSAPKVHGSAANLFCQCPHTAPVWDVPVAPRQFAIMMAAGHHWQCQPEPQAAPAAATVTDSA
jgi:hypothetical protein